ncbi:hypothetical protein JG687_00010412 [Phytophthora cactorum]|uniref:RxLR effector protein n=1 Tax=Phytophthora cactorum TaxID=29920 RepID=A0A329SND5_9STRA|nr:hypothetical protein Pcac1_g17386 [Phytophthora cactorum]KAG2896068.1 hypothetical protein PC114_g15250 [Phytophthora cactorum]KAG2924110.1 hypothetical protein PC117_g15481 [Phytophthora cactorum]KAG2928127.1 hypothetical protein PC115_g7291 [Phytophthora cactorum]KAG2975398.1 hypothetical protein PC118_g13958 [Phytophthora cactorum]
MRASLFLFLVVATIAVSLAVATDGDNTSRRLKGAQTSSVEEEPLSAQDEERNWQNLATKFKAGQLDDALAKMKGGQLDDAVAAAGGNKLQQALEKVKAQKALQNVEKVAETATTGKSKWQAAVAKIQAGNLSNLDTTNNKWQSAFNKLKASGQLKNVDETQVAKFTEGVAKEIAKNPEKSGKFGKIMQFVFGATLTGLIVYGINAMVTK